MGEMTKQMRLTSSTKDDNKKIRKYYQLKCMEIY